MKLLRFAILLGAVWLASDGANILFAQKKSAPANRPSKSKTQKTAESSASSSVPQPGVTVTQIDFAGLRALLKRAPDAKRPLLINFWATWCDPCREEFPELVKIDHEFRSRGLDFVTVSLDNLSEIKRDVPKFLNSMKAEMPAYLLKTADEDQAIAAVAPDWKGGLPMTVLYDAGGKLVYSRMGVVKPDVLRAEIEKVLPASTNASLND